MFITTDESIGILKLVKYELHYIYYKGVKILQ